MRMARIMLINTVAIVAVIVFLDLALGVRNGWVSAGIGVSIGFIGTMLQLP